MKYAKVKYLVCTVRLRTRNNDVLFYFSSSKKVSCFKNSRNNIVGYKILHVDFLYTDFFIKKNPCILVYKNLLNQALVGGCSSKYFSNCHKMIFSNFKTSV